ncbi:alkene reductase [Aliifodinibius sp. S!AR15-10]|uniref:alkene reductase n=1 Tax=Aliifodinibius sp. S!AR15-10 TaxID=2950437 RepID=UPI002858BED0|nr:alkene reductase [Aliifodinibius sp. S!AR15-10]MDR8393697.1 alkene reductase [Aliifodinibius sp. S!AR15-10]
MLEHIFNIKLNGLLMSTKKLFETIDLETQTLSNRLAMAPMTRNRAHNEANAPTELHAEYYSQRASAGLILSEGSQISQQGMGYIDTAGIHNEEQVEGWKKVLDAVHDKGGVMYSQLWHVGRVSHAWFHDGEAPVSSTAQNAESQVFTPEGFQPTSTPRALSTEEVEVVVQDFRKAARNAIEAGFDGVQIHGANGYLVEQFLHDTINDRDDRYGGPIENRARFLFEVLDEVIDEVGTERSSLRLSPSNLMGSENDSESKALYEYVIRKLNDEYELAFLELVEPLADLGEHPQLAENVLDYYGEFYEGVLMTNGNYDREQAIEVVEEGKADLVSFARQFLANPDLPERFAQDAPLNEPDRDTFYGGDAEGYTDYPFLEEVEAAK